MIRLRHPACVLFALLLVFFMSVLPPMRASAQAASTQISGTIVTQDNGLGVGGATVVLYRGGTVTATTTSNADGQYSFAGVVAGEYSVAIRATGYTPTRIDSVVALSGSTTTIRTPLRRARTTSEGGLREIGSTSATSRANSLASSATIQHNIDPEQVQQQGFLKAAEAIGQVPGVNLSGGPHTVGDDTSIDFRGMGAGEVRPLIDGHPIGPIGVLNQDYYNYANSPYALLDNINVTVGSGATGLYGVDVIGGTIDFQTLSPTVRSHAELLQEFGNDGTAGTVVKATGSVGRLGYAFGHAVTGTYGDFAPGLITQGARPNNNLNLANGGACIPGSLPDLTSCNTQLNTYSVSGNYKELSDLVKLRYAFTPSTALTLSGYDGNHHSDSTGNGDNDYIPYAFRLGQIQGLTQTCPGGYSVVTNTNPKACYTAQQYAAASYGPDGGGEDRNRGTTLQDFNARLNTQIGVNALSFGAFSDYYNFHKYSSAAAGLDPTGSYVVGTGTYTDDYLTHGFLVTDDIASATNDVGFGYFVEHQRESGNNIAVDSAYNVSLAQQPVLGEGDYSFFVRDNFVPTTKFAIYANAWDRRSSVTQRTKVDPRISFVVKPTRNDVVRLTAGQADGDPGANVAVGNALSGFNNPSSLNPACGNFLNSVATGGSSTLNPERSSDLEGAYGHRFWSDTSVNVVGYVSSVKDQLFSGVGPITAFALANPTIAGSLAGYAAKINSACGTDYNSTTVIPHLGLAGVFNASNALFRGIELTGRVRFAPWIALDYSYDVQSSQQFGEPANVLKNNPFILDGGQIVGIPVHKATFAADYTGRRGVEAQLQLYYVGNNNTLNRPSYTFYNAFISKAVARNVTATLSAYNIFNQNSQNYGYFGEQLPNPENQYGPAYTDGVSQAIAVGPGTQTELLGLQPRLINFSLSLRI